MTLEGKQFSHYRILQLIGRGGMGEVYLAEDVQVQRQVAAKVMRVETVQPDQESVTNALRLFWREATAIARLDHPAILPLYDHGEAAIDGSHQATSRRRSHGIPKPPEPRTTLRVLSGRVRSLWP